MLIHEVHLLSITQVTSQHPYAEMFIGEPNVYTVDVDDKVQLKAVIDKALTSLSQNKVS